jgi:hypothetical protein
MEREGISRATAETDIAVLPTKPLMQGKGEMVQQTPLWKLVSGRVGLFEVF